VSDDRIPAVVIGDDIRQFQQTGHALPWDKLQPSEQDYWRKVGEVALASLWKLDK
jgi:hypothetical protein